MKKFFTSDIHFDDERLNLFGRDIVFKTSKEFDNQIIENWNKTVEKDDLVYFLGDASLSKKGLENFSKLNGRKIIIKGNYDEKDTAKYEVSDEELSKYFDKVLKSGFIKINGEKIYLNHYPTNGKADCFNIVGHIHGTWKVQRNMINVGIDAWHFFPVSEDQIKFQINGIRNHYDENVFAGELKCNTDIDYKNETDDKEEIKESENNTESNDKVIYPPKIVDDNSKYVFLAGPIQGARDWQNEAVKILSNKLPKNFKIANPRLTYKPDKFDYDKQVDWETNYLEEAAMGGAMLFWLANEEKHDPKRSYAQTTRFELATWLERQEVSHEHTPMNFIFVGIESDFPGKKYIEKKLKEEYGYKKIYSNLEDLCQAVLKQINK